MWQFQAGQVLPVQVKMEDAIAERNEQVEVALHRPLARKQWKTKDGTFQVKQNPVVYDDPSARCVIDAQQVVGTLQFWIGRQILFGTTSWRRTCESLRVTFPHVSHRFTLVLAFWEAFWLVVFGFCLFWVVFCVCFVLEGSPRCLDVVVFFPTF